MRILPLIVCVALSGCASIHRAQAEREQQAVFAVCDASFLDARIRPLHGAVPLNASKASVMQLSDTSRFTADQKQALIDWGAAMAPCVQAEVKWAVAYDNPTAAAVYQWFEQQQLLLRARVVRDELTVGDFNQARVNLLLQGQSAMSQARQQYAAQQAQEAAANAAAWSQFNSTLQQIQQTEILRQQQQMMNRPVQTTCNRMGYTVNCTTY